MGLLKRFKQSTLASGSGSSSQSTSWQQTPSDQISKERSTSTSSSLQLDPPLKPPKFGTASSSRSIDRLAKPDRPELPLSGASSHSLASKGSTSRWRVRRRSQKESELVPGPAYNELYGGHGDYGETVGTSLPLSRDDRQMNASGSSNRTYVDTPPASAPSSPVKQKLRPRSQEYLQEGGILGRLNFEMGSSHLGLDQTRAGGLNSWLTPLDQGSKEHEDEAFVIVESPPAEPSSRPSDEVEVLDSGEKKQKFWKGIGRNRRSSGAQSELEEEGLIAEVSPTPKRASLPPVEMTSQVQQGPPVELQHPRPQNLRRPSSSFFPTTFKRSVSRASLNQDLETLTSAIDDGSFRLTSFRHVSGTADIPRQESEKTLDQSSDKIRSPPQSAAPLTSPSSAIHPPSAYFNSLPRPKMAGSRPPSVAGSVTSLDEMISSSPKISAAAFRRGARRPSESILPNIEPVSNDKTVEEDDDDRPLAMMKRAGVKSTSVPPITRGGDAGPNATRDKDEVGPSQLDIEKPPGSARLSPSPSSTIPHRETASPSASIAMIKTAEKAGSSSATPTKAFFVKSATTTRTDRLSAGPSMATHSRPPSFASPAPSKSTTPQPIDEPEILLSPLDIEQIEQTLAPPLISPGHNRPQAVLPLQPRVSRWTPSPSPSPSSQHASRSSPPPVAPLVLPQAGDTTPSSADLPLPPDLMPDTPPPIGEASAQPGPESPASTLRRRALSLGVFEEPLRVISGFWNTSPPVTAVATQSAPLDSGPQSASSRSNDADALESWVVSSSLLLGDDQNGDRAPSRMTLFDASASSDSSSRDPKRSLATSDARSNTLGSRPSLSDINTNIIRPSPNLRSPRSAIDLASPTSTGTIVTATPLVSSFRGPPVVEQKHQGFSHGRGAPVKNKGAWSSSESEQSESETESPSPSPSPGPPIKSRVSFRRVPQGPRKPSISRPGSSLKPIKSNMRRVTSPDKVERRSALRDRRLSAQSNSLRKDHDSDSSADEALSKFKDRVSDSRTSQNRDSPARSTVTLPTSSSLQIDKRSLPSSIPTLQSARFTGQSAVVGDHPAASFTPDHQPMRPSFSRTATSPESSLSGRTSEGLGQTLVTPRSEAYPPSLEPDHSIPGADGRKRHVSSPSAPWAGMPMHAPVVHPPPPFPTDPNALIAMKQAWQAHFMAAAYRASEEEWERASTVGGGDNQAHHQPSTFGHWRPPPSMNASFPTMPQLMPALPLPPHGIPYGYPLPMGPHPLPPAPLEMPYPHPPHGMSFPHYPLPLPPAPTSDLAGYQFRPGSQSVYGLNVGPPVHSPSTGVYAPHQYYQTPGPPPSSHDRHSAHVRSNSAQVQFEDAPTPRKAKRSTLQYAN
ncbi:hypothetical protein BD324DRAFT_607985 [Kockovaella imperatae]|uniref:Uncharacterized protein n=1 Tax=Kockovaella imperatae TaxID=4999 RepID=A0A1Y1UKG2_9TREE|nr:hypothetical protein BD324DRAFT_607985 [Kockovaella imperatae]ORX38543.1 hypothetical protein BD324DRAFT_607985 [Kockovaella imperatae]